MQGPVGYTPTCNCLPALHRLEKQVHDTQDHVYGQIQTTSRAMQEQINQVDHRSSMRVQALEKYTHDRFTEEENLCRQRIDQRFNEHDNYYRPHDDHMKSQIQNWLEQKLEGYGHCLHHHHDDSALPNDNIFSDVHETANGRLFKSRSDETLSQSDNHSGRYRKREFYESRQQAMQQIRAWQVPSYSRDRNRVKVVDRQRTFNEPAKRSRSRPDLNNEIEQGRHYPVEPRIEIRNRPQPQNAERTNRIIGDDTYMTMTGSNNQGAISNQSATPQPQVYPRKGSGSKGPMSHSTPKSRESSPYASHNGIVRSHTDIGISNSVSNSISPQLTIERKDSALEPKKQLSFSDKNLSDRSNVLTSQQQPTIHSSHNSVGNTVSSNSPYRNSTSSDHFLADAPKPTFSTFGYDDGHESRKTFSFNLSQQKVDQSDQSQQEVLSSSTPRSNKSSNSGKEEPVVNTLVSNTKNLFSRQNSQGSYGFTPRNQDDMYVEMKQLTPRLHQRAHSSEGILETDIDNINFNRSRSEERTLESLETPNTTRSLSETRDLQQSFINSPNSKSFVQQPMRNPSYHQQNSYLYTSPHPVYNSSPHTVQSGTVRSSTGPPTLPKPSVPSQMYATVREVNRGSETQYNRGMSSAHQNVKTNFSENVYSSLKDVQNGNNHNMTIAADVHNPGDPYYSQHIVNSTSSKQIQLEPRSKTAYQTYLTENPHFSSENLYHRENSPNICNNSKEDSSSNPDSGYSSKIYGNRPNSTTPASLGSTPSSSFSTDRGIHSNTNSPQSQYSNADYECLPKKQYGDEVQNNAPTWYQRKIQETTQKVFDSWRSERSPGKGLSPQQNGGQRLPVRYYGNSDYAKIDYSALNGREQNGQTGQPAYTPSGQKSHMVSTFVIHGSDV